MNIKTSVQKNRYELLQKIQINIYKLCFSNL